MNIRFFVFLIFLLSFFIANADENMPVEEKKEERGFIFGSYGRVQPATDLEGGSAKWVNIVGHGSRLEQGSYVELDLAYLFEQPANGPKFDFVSTLAFSESLFHSNGKWAALNTLRNLFVRAENIIWKPLNMWVGSRMFRGDDIYLLDFWPLDDANMYGGGIGLKFDTWTVDYYIGFNRLEIDWQYQEKQVVTDTFGAESITWMDRQRLVTGLKYEHKYQLSDKGTGIKWKLFAELQRIGEGEKYNDPVDDENLISYPEDLGWSVGGQLGFYGYQKNSFFNMFAKYSGGLAAYGLLSVPWGFDNEYKTTNAKEFLFGLSGNTEFKHFGNMCGAYVRYFEDADPNKYDNDDFVEFIFAIRPHVVLHEYFYLAFELSHQLKKTNGLTRLSDDSEKNILPQVTKISFIPIVTIGGGNYARPQLRLVYTAAFQNDDTKALYNKDDIRSQRSVLHYFGLSAEWWFNVGHR
ncbi:MAG TPA: carbohydrate porin [bacterium]|nr:carbohydrate porin [bacterium]HQM85583.1 carbohydrate porin [bacterium]